MGQEDDDLKELNYEGTKYKTLLTRKFLNRQPYVPEDPTKITATIPGTIIKIMVKEGQQVNPAKCLFILEAMKMRNKVFASVSGMVSKIHITEGQIVPKNQLLLELGEPGSIPNKEPKATEPVKERRIKRRIKKVNPPGEPLSK